MNKTETNRENLTVMQKIVSGLKWFGKSLLWLIPLLLALDIATKLIYDGLLWHPNIIDGIEQSTGHSDAYTIIPGFFYIRILHNNGAMMGLFGGNQALLVTISSVAGLAMCAFLAWKWKKINLWYRVALILMIPGCFGNLVDRAFYKNGVIDFLEFHFGNYVYPTFNLADSYIVVGCIVLIVGMIVEDYIIPHRQQKALGVSTNTETETKPQEEEGKKDE